jgi:hypothetical protein
MSYAHQGVELHPLAGFPSPEHAPPMPDNASVANVEPHPALLTRKGTEALIAVERMFDDASRAISAQDAAAGAASSLEPGKQSALMPASAVATAADRVGATGARGD